MDEIGLKNSGKQCIAYKNRSLPNCNRKQWAHVETIFYKQLRLNVTDHVVEVV